MFLILLRFRDAPPPVPEKLCLDGAFSCALYSLYFPASPANGEMKFDEVNPSRGF